jgi:hypothetical protein
MLSLPNTRKVRTPTVLALGVGMGMAFELETSWGAGDFNPLHVVVLVSPLFGAFSVWKRIQGESAKMALIFSRLPLIQRLHQHYDLGRLNGSSFLLATVICAGSGFAIWFVCEYVRLSRSPAKPDPGSGEADGAASQPTLRLPSETG